MHCIELKCLALNKTIALVGICILLAFLLAVAWHLISRPVVDCASEYSGDARIIRAAKVVAQPWLGPHHVYGIFVVPKGYGDSNRYRATMSIHGLSGTFAVGEGGERLYDSEIVIPQGHYPKQVYIPTRIALKGLVMGQFRELQSSCNWTLEFVEKVPSNSNIPLR